MLDTSSVDMIEDTHNTQLIYRAKVQPCLTYGPTLLNWIKMVQPPLNITSQDAHKTALMYNHIID